MNQNYRDRPASSSSSSPFIEPRVDPGVNTIRPGRVDRPSKLAPAPPKDSPQTSYPKTRR